MAEETVTITTGATSVVFTTITPSAFMIFDTSPLWDSDDAIVDNMFVPGRDGEVPYPLGIAAGRRPLTVSIFGDYTVAGVAVAPASQRSQLWTNIKHIRDNITTPLKTGDGTRSLSFLTPAGATVGPVAVQVVGPLRPAPTSPTSVNGTLDLLFVDGMP